MPYRHAHWFVLAIFPLAALAFWPQYLSRFAGAPVEMHLHGVTASLWLVLLALQSLTIHSRRRDVHRILGLGSLALFPLFMAGGAGIFLGMAQRYVAEATPFHVLYAPRLAWLDVVAVGGMAYFYFEALRQRRSVRLHAGYMLAIAIFLLPPILGRLSGALPPLAINGPQDFGKLAIGFQLANLLTAAIAFGFAFRARPYGRPFLLAGLLTLLSAALFQWVGDLAAWKDLYRHAADIPLAVLTLAAVAGGAAVGWAGWVAGKAAPMKAAAAPA